MEAGPPMLLPVPSSPVAVCFFILLTVGLLANMLLLAILWREPGWSVSKKLLMLLHGNGFVLLCLVLFPYVAAAAKGSFLTGADCAVPAALQHGASMLEIVSLLIMAHVRWKMLKKAAIEMQQSTVPANKYIGGAVAFIVVFLAVDLPSAYGTGAVPWHGPFFVCGQLGPLFMPVFILTFVFAAPYIIYCNRKITTTLSGMVDVAKSSASFEKVRAGTLEAKRTVKVLTTFYYAVHTPFFVLLAVRLTGTAVPIAANQWNVILFYAHSALSPLLVLTLMSKYRSAAAEIVGSVYGSAGSTSSSGGGKSELMSTPSTSAAAPEITTSTTDTAKIGVTVEPQPVMS